MKKLGEYHDVFENFRNTCLEIYELDPGKTFSRLALQADLKEHFKYGFWLRCFFLLTLGYHCFESACPMIQMNIDLLKISFTFVFEVFTATNLLCFCSKTGIFFNPAICLL